MGVAQEVMAADDDHRTGWNRSNRLVQSSIYSDAFWCEDDVSGKSVTLTIVASSRVVTYQSTLEGGRGYNT